jgi:hypothetical protein
MFIILHLLCIDAGNQFKSCECLFMDARLHGVSLVRRGFNIYIVINVRRRTDDQPQMTPRAQSVVVYLCVLCELCGFSSQLTGGCMGFVEAPEIYRM